MNIKFKFTFEHIVDITPLGNYYKNITGAGVVISSLRLMYQIKLITTHQYNGGDI